MFGQKMPHQTLSVFPVTTFVTNYDGDVSEPGYESLPDQSLLTNDPGYETVERLKVLSQRDPNSDYDPNYEVLRPANATFDDLSDHYAKVWSKSNTGDANDGYSSIKIVKTKIDKNDDDDDDDDNPGYCKISSNNVSAKPNHDYASIAESKLQATAGDENVYSSLNSDAGRQSQLSPILSMVTSASTLSESKTLTSPSSESAGTGDDTTPSSSNTPFNYNNIRSTTELTVSVSNYESLTGSESDSNYESVRYLNARDRENPYERLHNEKELKYDTLIRDTRIFNNNNNIKSSSNSSSGGDNPCSVSSNRNSAEHSDAGDYFQIWMKMHEFYMDEIPNDRKLLKHTHYTYFITHSAGTIDVICSK